MGIPDQIMETRPKHHVIISGPGRAGSSFLVQLLTTLGLDTEFEPGELDRYLYKNCNAGLERDIRLADAPYIVKSPWICDYIDEVVARDDLELDHAFVPIRDLRAAAQSRIAVTEASPSGAGSDVPGGLWHTDNPAEQEDVLAGQLSKLLVGLSKAHCPTTFIHYPKLTRDAGYLYRKLAPIMQMIEYREFRSAFRETVRPELVHQFSPQDI